MMQNPFEIIDARLKNIEHLLTELLNKEPEKQGGWVEPATRKEAAAFLKINVATLHNLIKSGQLKSFRLGRNVRIKWDDIYEFINDRS